MDFHIDHIYPRSQRSIGVGVDHVCNYWVLLKVENETFSDRLDLWEVKMEGIGSIARFAAMDLQAYISNRICTPSFGTINIDLTTWRTVMWTSETLTESKSKQEQEINGSTAVFIHKPHIPGADLHAGAVKVKNQVRFVSSDYPSDKAHFVTSRQVISPLLLLLLLPSLSPSLPPSVLLPPPSSSPLSPSSRF
jgi:hypothetical protein